MGKRCTDSTSLSLPELTVPRGKTHVKTSGVRSGCIGLPLLLCALFCSACSTTFCCIAVWTVESNYDFVRPIRRNRLCISGLGISRQTGFNLEFLSPRWIACQRYELHPPFVRFCLEAFKLLGELSGQVRRSRLLLFHATVPCNQYPCSHAGGWGSTALPGHSSRSMLVFTQN